MNQNNKSISEIATHLKYLHSPMNALAISSLVQHWYDRGESRRLIHTYTSLKSAYESAKAEYEAKYPLGHKDEFISRLGKEEGERAFNEAREAYSPVRDAENACISFRNEHPLILALMSAAKHLVPLL